MGAELSQMSGAKGEGLWGMDKVDDTDGQRRTFFMWINSKLEEGGHSRIGFDTMFDEFRDGVVIANLVGSLCSAKARKKFPEEKINYNPRNPLHHTCNVRLVFEFLKKVENEDMSTIPVNTITKGAHAYVMGLIFKFILRYSLSTPGENVDTSKAFSELLEWVKPKCEPHKEVKNFDTSWKDGVAVVALWNYLVNDYHKEYQVDLSGLDTDDHATVTTVIEEFSNKMGVEPYITAHMLLDERRPDKKSVMTWVAEVRDKYAVWKAAEEEKIRMEADQNNADNKSLAEANKWYQMGKDKTKEAKGMGADTIISITEFANDKMSTCNGSDEEFNKICDDARAMLSPVDEGYTTSTQYFDTAIKEYKKVKDKTLKKEQAMPKIRECGELKETNESLDDNIHRKVDEILDELIRKWKSKHILNNALEFYTNSQESTDVTVKDIIDKTCRSFTEFNFDRLRFKAVEDGRDEVIHAIEIMDTCKDKFDKAIPEMIDDTDIDICTDKMLECDDWKATWLQMYDDACKEELDKDVYVSYEETSDLLEEYHKFTHDLEVIISSQEDENGNLVAPTDDGVGTDYATVKSRLDELMQYMRNFKESEQNLREKVQAAVDEKFDEENLPGEHWYKANYDA